MKIDIAKIKLLLAAQEMTMSEFANRAGISRQSICTIMKCGTCRPTTASKLAKGLGVDVAEIVKQEG